MASLDLRGVNMTSDPQDVGGPDLANRAWDPLWEVCADLHLPVHFHIGASLTTMTYFGTYPWESQDDDTKLAIGGALLFIGNARVVTNIILSGMLDRHPKLQMVSVESGVGWIPFILEALDYEMSENAPKQLAHMSMLPSEYFKRNLFATFWFEKNNLPALIASVGEDSVLFETDFPHPTCLYPKPLETVAEKMSTLAPEVQRKILGENAAKSVPALVFAGLRARLAGIGEEPVVEILQLPRHRLGGEAREDFVPAGRGQPLGHCRVVQQAGHGAGHARRGGWPRDPVRPSSTIRAAPPWSATITGTPAPIASKMANGWLSMGQGCMNTSNAGRRLTASRRNPGRRRSTSLANERSRSSSGPSPRMTATVPGSSRAASMIRSGRFQSTSRIEPPITLASAAIPSCSRACSREKSAGSAMPFATIS